MIMEISAAEIQNLQNDKGIFNAKLFVEEYKNNYQTQLFSVVCVHHQNDLAEWSTQNIMYMAQTITLHHHNETRKQF